MRARFLPLVAVAALLLHACEAPGPSPDAASDAPQDVALDAPPDVAVDAPVADATREAATRDVIARDASAPDVAAPMPGDTCETAVAMADLTPGCAVLSTTAALPCAAAAHAGRARFSWFELPAGRFARLEVTGDATARASVLASCDATACGPRASTFVTGSSRNVEPVTIVNDTAAPVRHVVAVYPNASAARCGYTVSVRTPAEHARCDRAAPLALDGVAVTAEPRLAPGYLLYYALTVPAGRTAVVTAALERRSNVAPQLALDVACSGAFVRLGTPSTVMREERLVAQWTHDAAEARTVLARIFVPGEESVRVSASLTSP